jgi:hypothetical protein
LRSILSDPEEKMILHRFLRGSISVRTMTGYEREWKTWKEFVARKSLRADADP